MRTSHAEVIGIWNLGIIWSLELGAWSFFKRAFRTPTTPLVRARASRCAHRVLLVVLAQASATHRAIRPIAVARAPHRRCLNASPENSHGTPCRRVRIARDRPGASAVGFFLRRSATARA